MPSPSGAARLRVITKQALDVAKKASRHSKSLSGDNYYANKFVDLKASAREAFDELPGLSTGDATALAELLENIFDPKTPPAIKLSAQRELTSALRNFPPSRLRQRSHHPQILFRRPFLKFKAHLHNRYRSPIEWLLPKWVARCLHGDDEETVGNLHN